MVSVYPGNRTQVDRLGKNTILSHSRIIWISLNLFSLKNGDLDCYPLFNTFNFRDNLFLKLGHQIGSDFVEQKCTKKSMQFFCDLWSICILMKSFYQILLIWLNIYYRISNYNSGPFIYFIINDLAFLCHLNYYWAKTKKWHFSYDFFKVPTMIPNPLDDMWINVSVLMHYDIKLKYSS